MHAARRKLLMDCLKIFDLSLMVLSYLLAALIALQQSFGVGYLVSFIQMRIKVQNFIVFAALVLAWHIIFLSFGLYHSKRLSTFGSQSLDILKATTLGSLVMLAAAMTVHIRMITLLFVLTFWSISSITTIVSRLALRNSLRRLRKKGRNLRWMPIAGTNPRALEFARSVEAKPELGYRVLGFVDDEWAGTAAIREAGFRLACGFNDFAAFLRNNVVDELVIALPMRSLYGQASQIAAACEIQGITVRHLSIFDDSKRMTVVDGDLDYSLITHYGEAWGGPQVTIKRLLDICISAISLVLFGPLCLAAAVLIKLTSPGPVFFVQQRLGVNKRRFNMFKFRTMVPDAEKKQFEIEHLNEASGAVFKIKNDPRVTPIGKFLRKTSIDEIPQLFNVFKGDMSLVGPRPLPVRDYERFDQDWQRRRFSVRPGITCLWQVNGRSSIAFDEWMKLDLRYVDQWSLWLDLRILIKTVPAVLRGSGAV